MFCRKCGADLPQSVKFCPGCGNQIESKVIGLEEKKHNDSNLNFKLPQLSVIKLVALGLAVIAIIATGVLGFHIGNRVHPLPKLPENGTEESVAESEKTVIAEESQAPKSLQPCIPTNLTPIVVNVNGGDINCVAFNPDGCLAVTGDNIGRLIMWDLSNGQQIGSVYSGHTDVIWSVSFSPDGRKLLSGSRDHTVKLWEIESRGVIYDLTDHKDEVRVVAFNPDGTKALSGSFDGTLKLWDINTGKCDHTFKGHTVHITSLCFSPDGNFILSGGNDDTVKLWNVNSGNCDKTFTEFDDFVLSVAFSTDGTEAFAGMEDGDIKGTFLMTQLFEKYPSRK